MPNHGGGSSAAKLVKSCDALDGERAALDRVMCIDALAEALRIAWILKG